MSMIFTATKETLFHQSKTKPHKVLDFGSNNPHLACSAGSTVLETVPDEKDSNDL